MPSGPPADAAAVVAAWDDFPAVSFARRGGVPSEDIAVVMHGNISNAAETASSTAFPPRARRPDAPPRARSPNARRAAPRHPRRRSRARDAPKTPPRCPPPPVSPDVEGATLILELYRRRFEDKDGDPSDQPATALAACDGSFSFVLVDASRGAVLAARSRAVRGAPAVLGHGTHEPGRVQRRRGDATRIGTGPRSCRTISRRWMARDGGAAVAFPLGAFYYVDDSMDGGVIQRLRASGTKRKVRPVHRINSSGKVCGLGFYTDSGNDLASMAQKFVA